MARQRLYGLTERDRQAVTDTVKQVRQDVVNTTARPRTDLGDDLFPPEVYLARTPAEGIDALSELVGEDTSDTPGSAACRIYQLVDGQLEDTGEVQQVYNHFHAAIGGNRWALAARDKFGAWWIITPYPDPEGSDTGTGTDISGGGGSSSSCSPITLSEQEVRCEDGILNVYARTITLNTTSSGCLTKATGDWVRDRSEGQCGVSDGDTTITYTNINNFTSYVASTFYFNTVDNTININVGGNWYTYYPGGVDNQVSYTNINNFTNYIENTYYFNTVDNTLNINIGGYWYSFCPCYEDTGTGTGSIPAEPDTGTGTGGDGNGGGDIFTACCGGVPSPSTIVGTITNRTGTCTCLANEVTLTWNGTDRWTATLNSGCSASETWEVTCPGGGDECSDLRLHIAGMIDGPFAPASCSCLPFELVFNVTTTGPECSGSFRVTFTL